MRAQQVGKYWQVEFGIRYGRQQAVANTREAAEALAKRIMTRQVLYGVGRPVK